MGLSGLRVWPFLGRKALWRPRTQRIAYEETEGGRGHTGHAGIHVKVFELALKPAVTETALHHLTLPALCHPPCHALVPLRTCPVLWLCVLGLALWLQVLSLLGELQPHTDVVLPLLTVLHDTAAEVIPRFRGN